MACSRWPSSPNKAPGCKGCKGPCWSLATALSLLVWFVFAPQCIATLATVRRETNSWRMALLMASYMFALAYAASAATYHLTVALGG